MQPHRGYSNPTVTRSEGFLVVVLGAQQLRTGIPLLRSHGQQLVRLLGISQTEDVSVLGVKVGSTGAFRDPSARETRALSGDWQFVHPWADLHVIPSSSPTNTLPNIHGNFLTLSVMLWEPCSKACGVKDYYDHTGTKKHGKFKPTDFMKTCDLDFETFLAQCKW